MRRLGRIPLPYSMNYHLVMQYHSYGLSYGMLYHYVDRQDRFSSYVVDGLGIDSYQDAYQNSVRRDVC